MFWAHTVEIIVWKQRMRKSQRDFMQLQWRAGRVRGANCLKRLTRKCDNWSCGQHVWLLWVIERLFADFIAAQNIFYSCTSHLLSKWAVHEWKKEKRIEMCTQGLFVWWQNSFEREMHTQCAFGYENKRIEITIIGISLNEHWGLFRLIEINANCAIKF